METTFFLIGNKYYECYPQIDKFKQFMIVSISFSSMKKMALHQEKLACSEYNSNKPISAFLWDNRPALECGQISCVLPTLNLKNMKKFSF